LNRWFPSQNPDHTIENKSNIWNEKTKIDWKVIKGTKTIDQLLTEEFDQNQELTTDMRILLKTKYQIRD